MPAVRMPRRGAPPPPSWRRDGHPHLPRRRAPRPRAAPAGGGPPPRRYRGGARAPGPPPAAARAASPGSARRAGPGRAPAAVVIVRVALLLKLVYRPWHLNYDARYALLWARDA